VNVNLLGVSAVVKF